MPGLVNGGFVATTTATAVRTSKSNSFYSKRNNNFLTRSTVVVHFVAVIGRPRREFPDATFYGGR